VKPRNQNYLEWLASKFTLVLNFIDTGPFSKKILLLEKKFIRNPNGSAYVVCYPFTEKLNDPSIAGMVFPGRIAGWLEQSRIEGSVDIREHLGRGTLDEFFDVVVYLPSNKFKLVNSENPMPFIGALMDRIDKYNQLKTLSVYDQNKDEQLHKIESEVTRNFALHAETMTNFKKALQDEPEETKLESEDAESGSKTGIRLRDNKR